MAEEPAEAFAYRRSIAPMLWAFVILASIELLVVHLLVAQWSRLAAGLLSLLSFGSIVWLVGVIRSFGRSPVLLTADAVTFRVGTLRSVTVPFEQVAGLRRSWDAAALKRRDVLNLALLAYPNVVIDLHEPLPGRRAVRVIAHRLDDAPAFGSALARRLA